jgi:pilus assembly protein Flp/PilA
MLNRAIDLLVHMLPAALRRTHDDDRGQTLVEYGLLLFFLAIVVIVVLLVLGPTVSAIFQEVNDEIP